MQNIPMRTTLSIRLSEPLAKWVEEESQVTGRSKGSLVKEGLERLKEREEKPYLKLAGCVEGEPGLSQRKGFSAK